MIGPASKIDPVPATTLRLQLADLSGLGCNVFGA